MNKKTITAILVLAATTAAFGLVNGWQASIVKAIVNGNTSMRIFGALVGSEILFRLFCFFQDLLNRRSRVEIEKATEEKWQKVVEDANPQAINQITTGVILGSSQKLASLTASAITTAVNSVGCIIPAIMLIIGMIQEAPLSAVISIASLIVLTIGQCIIGRKKLAKRAWEVYKDAQASFSDTSINIMTIKFMGMRAFADKRQQAKNTTWSKEGVPIKKIVIRTILKSVCAADYVINIFLLRGNIGMVALFATQYYNILNIAAMISDISDTIDEIKTTKATLEPLNKASETPQILVSDIVLNNIKFGYENEEDGTMMEFGISDVVIKHGRRHILSGESGQGKSSFANLLAGVLRPSVGYVPCVDTFYVSQTITALNDTLWNNIVGDNAHGITEDEVLDLINQVGMGVWFTNLKNGFNTILGERGCKLSTGQVQRVNIIRAILAMRYNPEKLFILDEIVCNLDEDTKNKVVALIDRELKSTAIIISHQDGFAEICDQHLVVENHILRQAKEDIIKVSRCCG